MEATGEQEVIIGDEPVATVWRNPTGQWLAATIYFATHTLRPHRTHRAAVLSLIRQEVIPKARP